MLKLIEDIGMHYPKQESKKKLRYGLFKCPCGIEFKAIIANVDRGLTQSCGCLRKKNMSDRFKKHGYSNHRLYKIWHGMMQRCYNKNHKSYIDYGANGIKVCDRWHEFCNFVDDMEPTYSHELTIDRINGKGDYNPSNCRWANSSTQHRNTRKIMSTNTSGYRGVYMLKKKHMWKASICVNKKHIQLGRYDNPVDAALAYDKYIDEHALEHTKNF